jgi:hypothetical protein
LKKEEKEDPKPPSPRTIGLALGGVVILVLGAIGYLLFLDPLGLFKDAESPQAAAPAATAPAATPAQPAQPAPAPAATIADPGPGLMEETPEFAMPPPAPLVAGEEIAPGVVRLPRDADPVSATPAPRTYEQPAPKPNPAYTALVNNLNISGIRPNSSGGFLMVGTILYRPGDIVDQQSRLEFVGLDGQVITFKDPAGAIYTRRF